MLEGIEAIVFRTVGDQCSLWEAVLPAELLQLPEELARVDALLDDPVFFAPFVPFFDPRIGRPSTPMETYLRLMFLKFRYRLGYESLCREVSDSITWRRFCRIGLDGSVPHPTTLMKLTTRCGPAAVDGLNEALLAKAAEAKLLRTNRIRADTTVVPANVCYPTDSGLLAKAVRRIAVTGQRIHAAGGGVRTTLRDRSRAAGKRAHEIAAKLRSRRRLARDQAKAPCGGSPASWLSLAATAAAGRPTAARQRPAGAAAGSGQGRRAAEAACTTRPRGGGVVGWPAPSTTCRTCWRRPSRSSAQTRQRIAGITPDGASRGSACTTVMPGRSPRAGWGNRSSSGTRPRSSTTTTAIVLDHTVEQGNPPDAPQLAPAVKRVTKRAGRTPGTVTADRGYGEAKVDRQLTDLGVKNVVIPRKGKPSQARRAEEHRQPFRRTVKWRTGSEGRISYLKRGYGWDRTRIDGTEGARIWTGHGVLAHNLVKISALAG